jgi:chromosome segregation ATPase
MKKTVDATNIESKTKTDMSIFANKKDLEAAQSQIDSLQGDLSTLQAELATERETVAAQSQTIADMQASLDSITAEHEKANASLLSAQSRVTELEAEVITAANSAADQAVVLLASAGHEKPLEITEDAETNTFEKYQQLKKSNPAQATAYWNEHKATIIKQSK